MKTLFAGIILVLAFVAIPQRSYSREPLFRTIDLNIGEKTEVKLTDGSRHIIQVLDIKTKADNLTGAIRETTVSISIDNSQINLYSGGYHLPVALSGVQIDCPAVKILSDNSDRNDFKLEKDVRFRLWPERSPWLETGTFQFPLDQRLFANFTQMTNTPVGPGTVPGKKEIYYHSGLDFGGCEGINKVYSSCSGIIIGLGESALDSVPPPVHPRADVVFVQDEKGWVYRYSHLNKINGNLKLGNKIKMGDEVGIMGKEGLSGGWTHLHFAISAMMPSGKWGTHCAYPFIWEAYQKKYNPAVLAVVRPDQIARVGEEVSLDGSRSWSKEKSIANYQWELSNGQKSSRPIAKIVYDKPGFYSEILKVTDSKGNIDYDFAMLQVYGKEGKEVLPFVHACHYPSQGIKAGQEITFKVRTLRVQATEERLDFGDGSEVVKTRSTCKELLDPNGYAIVKHTFSKPGDYIVTVNSLNETSIPGMARIYVKVGKQ